MAVLLNYVKIIRVRINRDSFAQPLDSHLATKTDISRLELKLIEHEGEFKLIKWMLGIILGGVIALVLKAFFPIV